MVLSSYVQYYSYIFLRILSYLEIDYKFKVEELVENMIPT